MRVLKTVDSWLVEQGGKEADGYRKDDNGEWVLKERTTHHPSAFTKCTRSMYYEWTRTPVSDYWDATAMWRMRVGKWIERGLADILVEIFGRDAVKEQIEVFYSPPELKYPVHGYMDFNIVLPNIYGEFETSGIELKTSFGRGIVEIAKSGAPKESDEAQAKIYVATTNFLDSFSLPYLGRDSFYRAEFDIKMTLEEKESFKKKVIERFKLFEDYLERKELPPRDYTVVIKDGEIREKTQYQKADYKSDWQCRYCLRMSHCWREEIEASANSKQIFIRGDWK